MDSPTSESSGTLLVLQLKPFMDFKSQDEYLLAMKEDLAEWFNCLYKSEVSVENFFEFLDTGVKLCEHANNVRNYAHETRKLGLLIKMQSNFVRGIKIPEYEVQYREGVKAQTFQARDNISNFIRWTKDAGIPDVLSFETDDLVLRKNEKNVVLCLLEIARIGAKLGMLAPTLVQMEEEIDAEIAGEPPPQIITCDVKSLDEMVKWLAGRCTCPVQFPIIKVGEGKYKIGDSQTLVFVRILRKHVMIRVGGGWDTLEHYLDKHDPCRCNYGGHRASQGGAGQKQPTTPRRASTPQLSQTLPSSMKSPRKLSLVSNSYQRPPSPVRMRSASPGPNPRKLPTQPSANSFGSCGKSSSSSNGINTSSVNGSKNNYIPASGKLRSPSPGPSSTYSSKPQSTNRPASPTKRCVSPAPAKRCTSPSPARKTPTPSKHKIIATSRSTPNTPGTQRRQLPQPKMDSTESTENDGSVPSMDAISTMTLDEFKNLLNNALSVPNGNTSETSADSPRSQSSTESYRVNNTASKKPPISKTGSSVSKSFDASSRSIKNQTILEKPELPEKPKKILTSASWNRPKTPTGSSRPKTPVSSVTNSNRPKTPVSTINRPKTPVSTNRPKTPVSSSRPKTPTSNLRSQSVDSSNYSSSNNQINRTSSMTNNSSLRSSSDFNNSSDYSGRNSAAKNNTPLRSSTDWRQSSPMRTLSDTSCDSDISYDKNSEPRSILRTSKFDKDSENETKNNIPVNTSRDKSTMGSFTGMMASKFSQDSKDSEIKSSIQPSSFKSSTDFKSYKTDTPSFSTRTSSVAMKSDGFSPKEEKPNVGYVTINAENDYSYRKKYGDNNTSSNSVVEHVQSRLGLANDNKTGSVGSNGVSSAMESKLDLFKKTFQSSNECEEQTNNTSEFLRNNPYNRQSLSDQSAHENLPEDKAVRSTDNEQRNNLQSSLPRPSTPSGRCTPSLIPRPATPVGNIKELKEKAEKLIKEDLSSVTRSIENLTSSIMVEQTSPVNTEAPSRKISGTSLNKPTASSAVPSVSNAGRPPTPRKSNILVKSQTAASTTKGSYTSQFMQRRAMTPGPSKTENKIEPVRRSTTPGPNDRQSSLRQSQSFEMDLNESKTNTNRTQSVRSSTDFNETRQSRTVPCSPVVQRRPRTPSAEPRSLSRQGALDEDPIITVDRSKGHHSISVQRSGATPNKTPKPTASRIIARSPAAGRQKEDKVASDRSRMRSRSVDVSQQNPRTLSVDRSYNKNENGDVVLTINRKDGSHVVNKRTEAWVEDAAKTVAKTRHGSKLNKSLSHGYQRSKTPSPMDMHNNQSRSLEEIKAALSLPINGISIDTDVSNLEAPPEDPEMYATMDRLFEQMRQNELRASVNETPGVNHKDVPNGNNDDEYSLDSNENVKRKVSVTSRTSSRQSTPSRESVKSTLSRPKTPSMSRTNSSSQPINRPASTPPRPCTPTRSKTSSRRSSQSDDSSMSSGQVKRTNVNHATILVSKIKEILNVKPRKDNIDGPKTRIPAPASLSKTGKSKSFSNLSASNEKDNPFSRQSSGGSMPNGDYIEYNGDIYDDYDECGNEVGYYSRNNGSDSNSDQSDRVRSGSKTPVPKIATPLSTGRTSLLNTQRENSRSSSKLVRAMSASSLSSTTSQTLSYTTGEFEDGYV